MTQEEVEAIVGKLYLNVVHLQKVNDELKARVEALAPPAWPKVSDLLVPKVTHPE